MWSHLIGASLFLLDSIAAAVRIVDKSLRLNGLGQTNVYFTGHSLGAFPFRPYRCVRLISFRWAAPFLGTAIASLAYARAVSGQNDFSKNAVIRDAYLFATVRVQMSFSERP